MTTTLPDKGYRIRIGPVRSTNDGYVQTLLLQRWESRVVGSFWNRRLEFDWHTIQTEEFPRHPFRTQKDRLARARASLIETAHLEEETRSIELRWTERKRK